MSKDKVFFNEMLDGIKDYQSFSDFCSNYNLWKSYVSGLYWDFGNCYLQRMTLYTKKRVGDQYQNWMDERDELIAEIQRSIEQSGINKIYLTWTLTIRNLEGIVKLPRFYVFGEYLFQMVSFNGKGGLWFDPRWTVLINPKFLTDLDLIPEPKEPTVFQMSGKIPMLIIGDKFGIVSQNGILFSDPNFDTSSIRKFLALWESGDVVEAGNELRPTVDFCRDLSDAKSYHQGRVTKVRTHWRMQRRGLGRKISQRKLIWEHLMRLPDKRADIQSHLDEAV